MSIKSLGNNNITYTAVWEKTGTGAMSPPPSPIVAWGDRGVYGGGSLGSNYNIIDYITISSTGDATDFGDLTAARNGAAAMSSVDRGVWGGGNTGSA